MREKTEKLKAAERLIYEYQKRRLETEYSDFEGMNDVTTLFFNYYYPPPEEREEFEKLKKAYVRTMKNPLMRLFCSRWVMERLEAGAELDSLTQKLNSAVTAELAAGDPMPDELDDNVYFDLCRKATTYEQRARQLECAVLGYELGVGVVIHFPLNLQQIIRIIPRPLVGNRALFDLAVETYLAFYNHKKDLQRYFEVTKEREYARLEKMFRMEDVENAHGDR